jgi:hypothetical protein
VLCTGETGAPPTRAPLAGPPAGKAGNGMLEGEHYHTECTVGEEPVRLGADASSQVARGVSAAHGAVTISLAPHCRDRHHPVRAVPDLPPRLS